MTITPTLAWGSPSPQELLIILVIFMVLFGARRLPELSRSLGKSISEFKRGRREGEKELEEAAEKDKEDAQAKSKDGSGNGSV